MCTPGPANEITARCGFDSGRVRDERRVAGEEVERDLGLGAVAAGGDRVAELVDAA